MSIKLRQRGLTLVELIIFIVVVGVAVVGVLGALSLSARNSADPLGRKQALAIAESLMEEVRLAGFTFCDGTDPALPTATSTADCTAGLAEVVGPESGNTRPFDNVNDYVTALGTAKVYTQDVAGVDLPSGYRAEITLNNDGAFGTSALPSADLLRITVTVTYGSDSVVLESYRARYAPNHAPVKM